MQRSAIAAIVRLGAVPSHGAGAPRRCRRNRSTGIDGTQVTDTFSWASAGIGGQTLNGRANFP
jgi:hypothetical protein